MVSRFFKIIFIVLIFFSLQASVISESSNSVWLDKGNGISCACIRLSDGLNDEFLYFIRIDSSLYDARILSAEKLGSKTLTVREIAEKAGACAVINASYFDENDNPLGYLKIKGKVINDYIAEPIIYSGMLAVFHGSIKILHRDNFQSSNYGEALQAGPRLIAGGKPTVGIENTIDYKKKGEACGNRR